MDARDKTLPRGPQETAGPDPSHNPDAILDNPGLELEKDVTTHFIPPAGDSASLAFTDEEPADDVGGEVGRKPLLDKRGWQIVGAVAGGVAVVAGVAAVIYARQRQTPKSRIERFAHKAGLNKFSFSRRAMGYGHELDRARDRLSHLDQKAREQISHLEDMARNRLSHMHRPHLSDFHFGRNPAQKASDRILAFFR